MIVVQSSAVAALARQEEARKAREDRMRNALEILAGANIDAHPWPRVFAQHVRSLAREGLGRGEPANQEE